jgi:Ti-type conjugative transfer relaxase TraA
MAAAAAYRSGCVLRDERYGVTHNYSRSRPAAHTEIMAPAGAPAWVQDREALWNRVEAGERRKDAQLARALEIGLPVELSLEQGLALVRDYIAQEFISKGMVADFCIRRDDSNNPYAHILLTLRDIGAAGFGAKMRQWNRKSILFEWRAAWAERANQHLARAGQVVRIDHRTLEAQQSELTPGRRMGVGRGRQEEQSLPSHLKERVAERQRIAKQNGEVIMEDPTVALRALTRQRPIFTQEDLVRFLRSRTDDDAQRDAALAAITASSELVPLTPDGEGRPRFTSRDLLEAEKSLMKRVAAMAARRGHGRASEGQQLSDQPRIPLSEEQRTTLDYVVAEGDIKALAPPPGETRGTALAAARELWESQGLRVIGVALSRIAVENLQASAGIPSRTLEEREREWQEGREPLTLNHVVVVDGAEMIGLKQMERILALADKARGKVVLVGDSRQLKAMSSTSPLHGILERIAPGAAP